jgi:hypothetical protein
LATPLTPSFLNSSTSFSKSSNFKPAFETSNPKSDKAFLRTENSDKRLPLN